MILNDKLNTMQSRSTSRPPAVNRMNNKQENDDELVSNRFSVGIPRGQLSKRSSYYVQQSRQMHSEMIGGTAPQMKSFEKLKSNATAREDKEFFMEAATNKSAKNSKKINTERSRVLRPIAGSSMLLSKGSVERGFKEMT